MLSMRNSELLLCIHSESFMTSGSGVPGSAPDIIDKTSHHTFLFERLCDSDDKAGFAKLPLPLQFPSSGLKSCMREIPKRIIFFLKVTGLNYKLKSIS